MVELASDFLDRSTPIFRDDVAFFVSQSGMYMHSSVLYTWLNSGLYMYYTLIPGGGSRYIYFSMVCVHTCV